MRPADQEADFIEVTRLEVATGRMMQRMGGLLSVQGLDMTPAEAASRSGLLSAFCLEAISLWSRMGGWTVAPRLAADGDGMMGVTMLAPPKLPSSVLLLCLYQVISDLPVKNGAMVVDGLIDKWYPLLPLNNEPATSSTAQPPR
ncbi:hypothetical protein [Telmatospirillum siberiense]|uniref:Uncharacterized protein n=1 Tax=Telmatospirillum siberiense TaxID=382514 RepID=A0A2N3PNK1_9PROT|nr:hypothetical protein [Telmatospirillum siberiense]PKU21978.1 hypothetical protein CWS72_24040 [Telmatospirillum siberiense]